VDEQAHARSPTHDPDDADHNSPNVDTAHSDAAGGAALQKVRDQLVRDAEAAGVDGQSVQVAIDKAVAGLAQAPVRSFVGVLVERAVREQFSLRRRPS
jgi:hypothetical protein